MSGRLIDAATLALCTAANKAYLAAATKDAAQLARAVNSLASGLLGAAAGLPHSESLDAILVIGKALLLHLPQAATAIAFGLS